MSDVNDILSSAFSDDDDVIFDPSENGLIHKGSYPAHIVGIKSVIRSVREGAGRADIYKPTYKIANSVRLYGGMEVPENGIWRFRKAKSNTNKPSPPNNNRQFRNAMKALDIEAVPVEVDGRKLFKLPELNHGNTYGKPVIINVYHNTFDGKYGTQTTVEGKLASKWEDGGQLEEAIPF